MVLRGPLRGRVGRRRTQCGTRVVRFAERPSFSLLPSFPVDLEAVSAARSESQGPDAQRSHRVASRPVRPVGTRPGHRAGESSQAARGESARSGESGLTRSGPGRASAQFRPVGTRLGLRAASRPGLRVAVCPFGRSRVIPVRSSGGEPPVRGAVPGAIWGRSRTKRAKRSVGPAVVTRRAAVVTSRPQRPASRSDQTVRPALGRADQRLSGSPRSQTVRPSISWIGRCAQTCAACRKPNAEIVGAHLAAAGQFLDDDPRSGARSRAGGPRPSRPDRCGARGGRHRGLPRPAMGRGAQRVARGTTDHRRSAQSRRDR